MILIRSLGSVFLFNIPINNINSIIIVLCAVCHQAFLYSILTRLPLVSLRYFVLSLEMAF